MSDVTGLSEAERRWKLGVPRALVPGSLTVTSHWVIFIMRCGLVREGDSENVMG